MYFSKCLFISQFRNLQKYYETTLIKAVWYWTKNKQIDQWNRTDNPDTDPYKHNQLIFGQRSKGNTMEKIHYFQQMVI